VLRRLLLEAAIIFVAYYLAGKLGQATTEIRSSNLGPVWPAYGVALAAVLLCGTRALPPLALSMFVVAFHSPVPFLAALGQTMAAILAVSTGGSLLRRAGFDSSMSRLRDALSLIVLGALASAMVSASLGTAALYATGMQAYSGIGSAWLIYWLGDSTGVLLVTPLILTASNLLNFGPRARAAEFAALILLLVLACLAIFGDLTAISVRLHVLAFAVLPFIIWAAIRFGVSGVAISTLLVASIATVATALGGGPFAQDTAFTNAVLLDVFFAVLAVSGLVLATVIAERAQAEAVRERLIREQAAVEVQRRLAAIVETSDDAIIRQDVKGEVTDWNAGAERLYGYSASEAIGQSFSHLVRSACDDSQQATLLRDTSKRETIHCRKDGTPVEVSLTISPILDATGLVVGASVIARDITERQRAAAALRESEDKLRLILDSAAEGIYGIDREGRCTFCNQACLRILGYESDGALLGRNMHQLIHHSRADRSPLPVSECRIFGVLHTGQGIHVDDDVLWRADGTSFPAEWWSYPQRRGDEVVGAVVGFNDVTQHKAAEEKAAALRDELAHLGRVNMLSALTGALAHEISQPLTSSRINAEAAFLMISRQPSISPELREALESIRRDNQRASDVLQHLRSLLKKEATRFEPVEINSTVSDVVKLIRGAAVKRGILIDVELASEIEPILADRVQVQQVVLNLLMNACDAVEANDTPRRRVTLKTVPGQNTVSVEVRDCGVGLSDEQLGRIFKPFYTTKRDGMGLGLSICRAIVGAHGGTLQAQRNPDSGMTFSAAFPFWQSAKQARSGTPVEESRLVRQ
jgi:PAS domain S-box-containing protein